MNHHEDSKRKLAAPGAGISSIEMLVLNHIIKPLSIPNRRVGEGVASLREGELELIRKIDGVNSSLLTARVLVSRPWFVEDSSRNWSAALLFRHLAIVNMSIAKTVSRQFTALAQFMPPVSERVSAVKPEAEKNQLNAIAEFQESVSALEKAVKQFSEEELRRKVIPHPWLGDLTHVQWLWFAGFHQRVHGRHLDKILLGIDKLGMEMMPS